MTKCQGKKPKIAGGPYTLDETRWFYTNDDGSVDVIDQFGLITGPTIMMHLSPDDLQKISNKLCGEK